MRSSGKRPELLLDEAQRLTDQAGVLWNAGSYPPTEALCRRALKLTRSAVGDQDALVAERLYNLATLYHFQRRFEEARPLYQEAILIHEAQPEVDRMALAFCLAWLGRTHFEACRDDPPLEEAEEDRAFCDLEACYRRALSLLEEAGAAESPEYAGCLLQIGFAFYYRDQFAEAEPLLRQALELRERLFGPDHLETAEALGRYAMLVWQDPAAGADPEPFVRRAFEIRKAYLDDGDPELWEWLYRLAEFCRAAGRDEEAAAHYAALADLLLADGPLHYEADWIAAGAVAYLREMGSDEIAAAIDARWNSEPAHVRMKRAEIERREAMFGSDSPRVAGSLRELADDLQFDARYDEALSLYRRALAIQEGAEGCQSAALLPILNGLAMLFRAQDDLEEARAALERARAIPCSPEVAEERKQHARALEQLAWIAFAGDDNARAETLFHEAIEMVESAPAPDFREMAEMRYRLSMFYSQCGRHQEAHRSVVAALKAAEQTADLDELEIADYREQYAAALAGLGRRKDAAKQQAEVERIWQEAGIPRP